MRYVEARIDEYNREEAYRIYVTQSLRLAPQNKYMQSSYVDMMKNFDKKPEPKKSGDEVVVDIIKRAGLKFGE